MGSGIDQQQQEEKGGQKRSSPTPTLEYAKILHGGNNIQLQTGTNNRHTVYCTGSALFRSRTTVALAIGRGRGATRGVMKRADNS